MGRQRLLGFIAIGLGVFALLTALPHRGWERGARFDVPVAVAVPAMPAAPAAPQAPDALMYERGPHRWDGGPWMHRGWGGPGFFLGGLLKLAMIFFLVSLGIRMLRGRRGGPGGPHWRFAGGPPWRHGPQPWQDYTPPPPARSTDDPSPIDRPSGPQTGPTTRL